MQWVTRKHVHLDRVASPWLISRFVDPEAEFLFIGWEPTDTGLPGAIPLALPGAELNGHDAQGTTFDKIVRKYGITDPAILRLGRVIKAGVHYVLEGFRPSPDDEDGQVAVGLLALAEGMMLVHQEDQAILDASYILYDALYARYRTFALMQAQGRSLPDHDYRGPTRQFEFLRAIHNATPYEDPKLTRA